MVMMGKYQKRIFRVTAAVVLSYWLLLLAFGMPVPRGTRCDDRYCTYYRNVRGIYYISVEHPLALINYGRWDYLSDVDKATFTVLDEGWAKDRKSVWCEDKRVASADVASFHIDKSGLPKDKNHVYVYDADTYSTRPTRCGIDVRTAEYFVRKHDGYDRAWMRDKDSVYFDETKVDVDRNTFAPLGNSYWWTDKDCVYRDGWDNASRKHTLIRVDSLRSPLDTLGAGCPYLRNGRNIIYHGCVVAEGIDVERFEEIGINKCVVNDRLFYNGERILEDSLDVPEARFYFYGHIAADKHRVFYGRRQLDGIDAASFHQVSDGVFEDKDFRYTIKENSWREKFPFNREKKR